MSEKDKAHDLHYRPDIDGLRAIAIVSVLIFHAFPEKLKGGFVGVDIFFVISGYLISTIIFKGLLRDKFSFVDFYSRRIRRIFPSLILILVVAFCLGWYLMPPEPFMQLGKQIVGGMSFVQNFLLWNESGYFDKASDAKPLMHLWSLAVEEQYYVIYPALVIFAWRLKGRALSIIIIVMIASFLLNLYGAPRYPVANFFMPLTRFWEIFAGGILAWIDLFGSKDLAPSFKEHQISVTRIISNLRHREVFNNACAVVGSILILAAVVTLNSQHPFPGWRALLPVVGAWLLILAGQEAWINRQLLSGRLIVFVGLISYPLYLWHWMILSFLTISKSSESEPMSNGTKLGALASSFVLAFLTYFFVERPIRLGAHKKGLMAPTLCILALLVSSIGFITYFKDGLPFRYSAEIREIAAYKHVYGADTRVVGDDICWLNKDQPFSEYSPSCSASLAFRSGEPSMLIWGDSHAASLYPGLATVFGSQEKGIAQFTRDGCPPVLGTGIDTAPLISTQMGLGNPNCIESNESVLSVVEKYHPKIVVLFASWITYAPRYSDENRPYVRGLRETVRRLKKMGVVKILLIGTFPRWPSALPNFVLEDLKKNPIHRLVNRLQNPALTGSKVVDDDMMALAKNMNVMYFSILDDICNENGCLIRVDNDPTSFIVWDESHLTTPGAQYIAQRLSHLVSSLLASP